MRARLPTAWVAALLLAGTLVAPAHAAERRIAAIKLLPYFDFYLGMAEARRDRFRPAYQLLVNGQPFTGPVFLLDGDQRTPLTLGPDGRFESFPTLPQLRRRVQIALDAPPHATVKSDLGVEALAPHADLRSPEIPTATLRAALDQLNTAMHSAAGVLSFIVPRFGRTFFVFGGRKGVTVAADGRTAPLPLGEDEPVEPFYSPTRAPDAVGVRFPAAPARVLMVPGK